jgi:hypothetical protein
MRALGLPFLVGWLAGWLVGWVAWGVVVGGLAGWLAGWLAGLLAGWLTCWLAGRGWLLASPGVGIPANFFQQIWIRFSQIGRHPIAHRLRAAARLSCAPASISSLRTSAAWRMARDASEQYRHNHPQHFRRSKFKGLGTWRVLPPNNTEMINADHLAKAVSHPKVRLKKNPRFLSPENNLNRNEARHVPCLTSFVFEQMQECLCLSLSVSVCLSLLMFPFVIL